MKELASRMRLITTQHIEAKQRRVKECKEDVLYLKRRLQGAEDRLLIAKNELKEVEI